MRPIVVPLEHLRLERNVALAQNGVDGEKRTKVAACSCPNTSAEEGGQQSNTSEKLALGEGRTMVTTNQSEKIVWVTSDPRTTK